MEKKINKLVKNQVNEINKLHNEIVKHFEDSIEKAIKMGELLYKQKLNLIHGEFEKWIKDNLIFGPRQAERYIMIYEDQNYVNYLVTAQYPVENKQKKHKKSPFLLVLLAFGAKLCY